MTEDAAERLAQALDAEDEQAARRLAAQVGADRESRDSALDLLACRAADRSPLALELLAELVDECGLARAGVRRVLVSEVEVDDVTQDTLISMAASIGSFSPAKGRFVTWLFHIARNRAVDYLRRQQHSTGPRATGQLGDDAGEAQRISSLISTRETVQQMVRQLPDHYRRAVVLRDIERLPYVEVAERLELNVNTVKSHVARGRALLASMLSDQER